MSIELDLARLRTAVDHADVDGDDERAEVLGDVAALLAIAADLLAGRRVRPDRFNALHVDGLQEVCS